MAEGWLSSALRLLPEKSVTIWKGGSSVVLAYLAWVLLSKIKRLLFVINLRRKKKIFIEENKRRKEEFAKEIKRLQPGDSHEKICALSLEELRDGLQNDKYTPTQVLRAFQRKTADVDEDLNLVVAYIPEAQEWAENLERNETRGPLYGIPLSMKESVALKGYPACRGHFPWVDQMKKESWLGYKILQSQGAVPFVQTNTPYLCMTLRCQNPLFGVTGNPLDPRRTSGGSSGGEGAIVAAGASVLSIGTDIGGSVRIPAAWCGVVGLKSCTKRISNKGQTANMAIKNLLFPTYGPISRDVDSAAFVMRHLLVDAMWQEDFNISPLPWRQEIYEDRSPLRIGYYDNNGIFECTPPVVRAVRETIERLEAMGHRVVPFQMPMPGLKGKPEVSFNYRVFSGDGGRTFRQTMDEECDIGNHFVMPLAPFPSLPRWLNVLYCRLVGLFNAKQGKRLEMGCGTGSTHAWWELVRNIESWRHQVAQKFLDSRLDAILCPVLPSPPLYDDQMTYPMGFTSYTNVYNLLDWTAGVLPVTKVTPDDVNAMRQYPKKDPDHLMMHRCMVGAEGLPIAVQVATPPFRDELCLRILKQIEQAISTDSHTG